MSSARPTAPQHFRLAGTEHPRFGEWRNALADVLDIGANPNDIGLFDGDIAVWASDRFVLTEIKSSGVRLVRSPETIARSHLDQFAMTVLGAGSITGLAAQGTSMQKPAMCFFSTCHSPPTCEHPSVAE